MSDAVGGRMRQDTCQGLPMMTSPETEARTAQLTFLAGAAFLAAGFLALVVVDEAAFLAGAACNGRGEVMRFSMVSCYIASRAW